MLERAAGDNQKQIREQAAELKPQPGLIQPSTGTPVAATERRNVSAKVECPRFLLTLSGWFEGHLRAQGAGQLSLVVRNSAGQVVGEFASDESAIHPIPLREALVIARRTGDPDDVLRSVMHYLMNEGGVQIYDCTSLDCIQQHPDIPGALNALPDLETVLRDPDRVDLYFEAVGGKQGGYYERISGEIRDEHGTLSLSLEGGGPEEPFQRRFIVSSPKTLSLSGAPLRQHLLSLARFFVACFQKGGAEEAADQLATESLYVSELYAQKVDQQVAELRGSRGLSELDLTDAETNPSTGTTTVLHVGEERAILVISPDMNRDDYWVSPKLHFASSREGADDPFSDVQLQFIRTVTSLIRSSQMTDRVRGVQLAFSQKRERYSALTAELPELPGKDNPVSNRLRLSLHDLHVFTRSHLTDLHSETPREILDAVLNPVAARKGAGATKRGLVTVEADPPDSVLALTDSLEGRVSRIYKLERRFLSTRFELLRTMRITRGIAGGMRITAENDAGGSITALLPNTIGLSSEEMNRREASLIRAFAKQISGSWLDLQREIEEQMYGAESLSKSAGGVWDGTLNGIPPLSDVPGVQAYALASDLVRWTMHNKPPGSTDIYVSWLSPGQVLVFIQPPRNCLFAEIYLSETRLTHLRFGMVGDHLGRLSLVPSLKNGKEKPALSPLQFVAKEPILLGPDEQELVRRLIWSVHTLKMKLHPTDERRLPSCSDAMVSDFLMKHFI